MALKSEFDADFGSFISELTKVEVKLRSFSDYTDKSSAKLERMANSLQGNKIAEQAAVAVAAIQKIDNGVKGLTDSELKRYGAAIDEATQKFERMGREVPPAMASVKAALDDARQQAQALSDVKPPGNLAAGMVAQTEQVSGGFGAMKVAAMGAVAGIASSIATKGIDTLQAFAAEALDTGGKVADLAAKTGLTTKEVQTFGYAATMAGSSMDTVTGAVTKLSDNLMGGSDSTVAALKTVGLTLSDLQAMQPGEAFSAVAEAVAKIPDPMMRTNVAIDLLGKSGAELLPAITAGFSDAAEEAARLGLVIDDESIAALDDLGDTFDRVELRAKVAFANMAKHLDPMIRAIERIMGAKPEEIGDTIAGVLNRTGQNMWYSAQEAYNNAPWTQKLGTAIAQGPKQFLGRAMVGAGNLFGDPSKRPYDPNFDPNNPLAAMPGMEAMPIPPPKPKPPVRPNKAAAKAITDEANAIAEMTGAKAIADAEKLADRINKIGASKIPAQNVKALADQLMRARALAGDDAPPKLLEALNQLPIAAKQVPINMLTVQGSINAAARSTEVLSDRVRGTNAAMTGLIQSTNPLSARLLELPAAVEGTRVKITETTNGAEQMTAAIQATAQAFATLAQVAGGAFGVISQGIGTVFASADAGAKFSETLAQAFVGPQGMKPNAQGQFTGGQKAAAAAGMAMAGFSTGAQFGGQFQGKTKGALAGAASGAATGAMMGMVAGPIGAGVGALIGGAAGLIGGMMAGGKKDKEARAAIADHKKQLLSMYESREDLIEQAKRVGFSESELRNNILDNTKHVDNYEKSTQKLADAFEKEKKQAEALTKELDNVAKVNGVLSKQQAKDLRAAAAVGGGPRTEAAQAFINQQANSLMEGLRGALESGAALSPALVASIGESLPAAFAELQRSGMSTIDALKAMDPLLTSFMQKSVLAGAGSTPGFDALNAQLGILKDEKLGPMIEQAGFASQAMAALQNTGWLTQQTFAGFSESITSAFQGMIAGGASGESALAMLHQPLQNLWQLQSDFGYEVTEATQAMIDQGLAAGTIGEKFRPAAERMAESMDKVVERLDEMIAIFSGDLVDGAKEGAGNAGKAITDAFAGIRPKIIIDYEYGDPGAPPTGPGTPPTTPAPPPGSTNAAQRATEGAGGPGDVYLDGDRVGYHVARRLDDISARVT